MEFKASLKQIKKVCVLACEASVPVGKGHAHYNPDQVFKEDDFDFKFSNMQASVHLDYVGGRMVKLALFAKNAWSNDEEEIIWRVTDSAPKSDYQSWVRKYPTYRALLEASGINLPDEEKRNNLTNKEFENENKDNEK